MERRTNRERMLIWALEVALSRVPRVLRDVDPVLRQAALVIEDALRDGVVSVPPVVGGEEEGPTPDVTNVINLADYLSRRPRSRGEDDA